MVIALIGATGLVGKEMLNVLEEKKLPFSEIIPVASEKSVGKKINYANKKYFVVSIDNAFDKKPNYVLFSAGSNISLKWAPKFAEIGSTVIDNSSAWRMDNSKKLIIPEINGHVLNKEDRIISNPNCSTIQMLMVINPIHRKYGIKRIIISTYQSVTGTGQKAINQLKIESVGENAKMIYPHPIYQNALPHCDSFEKDGYTKEELKLERETCKILNTREIAISATAVRIPVIGGHSESINLELKNPFEIKDIKEILNNTPGVIVQDDPKNNIYPMPITAKGKDDVFVGRIRRDFSCENSLNLWIVADNLRKGAATNTIQILEYLLNKK
ncbi:MAG: aspartate-semialdehyde dehydrogenase [Flavobacteriaceae bacterium]|nr:aspartate-semialdehyde dehydrogenase [Flavobacteriaceae bacterium]